MLDGLDLRMGKENDNALSFLFLDLLCAVMSAKILSVEVVYLTEIIKQKPKAVEQAATKWVERYELKPSPALRELLTTLFQVSFYNT
jgi:hypothetical protein